MVSNKAKIIVPVTVNTPEKRSIASNLSELSGSNNKAMRPQTIMSSR